MPVPTRLPRITITGLTKFERAWDTICSAIERALNLSVTPPLTLKWDVNGGTIGLAETPNRKVKLTANSGGGAYAATKNFPRGPLRKV